MSAGKTVGVYLRVSTDDQSHDSQRAEVLRWIHRGGIDPGRVAWYVDSWTGRETNRPDLNRLREDVDAGRLGTVVVYKLDRLGRNMLDALTLLSAWCQAGVRVASATQPIDVQGVAGKIVAAVLLGVAEIELEQIRDRQRAGIEVAKSKGVYRGRAAGAIKAQGGRERAREMRARGLKLAEIAATLKTSTRTVMRYLDSDAEAGCRNS